MSDEYFELTANGVIYDVLLGDLYGTERRFIVGPTTKSRGPGGRGCVLITFRTNSTIKVVSLQWFEFDPLCAKRGGIERGHGSKSMLIGAIAMFKEIAKLRYPHLDCLSLDDLSRFVCERKDTHIPTCITSLVNTKKTYYQRLLNVSPSTEHQKRILDLVLELMNSPLATFDDFWTKITEVSQAHQPRRKEDLAWLDERRTRIRYSFDALTDHAATTGRKLTWRHVLKKMFMEYNCKFFECCFQQLSDILGIRGLEGVLWEVGFDDIPTNVNGRQVNYSFAPAPMQGGGSRARKAKFERIIKAAAAWKRSSHKFFHR